MIEEAFVGAVISLLVQVIKKLYKEYIAEEWQDTAVLGTLVLFSIGGALIYQLLVNQGLWECFYKVIVNAAAIWALLIKRVENNGA